MQIDSLTAKLALLKEDMKKTPCKRCSFCYDQQLTDACPKCADLDDAGLNRLFEQREVDYQARRSLGMWFYLMAGIISVLLLISMMD